MIALHRELAARALPARMLLQVHDELIVEAKAGAEEKVGALMREVMEGAASLRVPLKVELGSGRSWADLKG